MTNCVTKGVTVCVAGLAAGEAWAHAGDIGLTIRNARIVTGASVELNGDETVLPGHRVFGGELSEFGGVPFTDEPGLAEPDGVFPGSNLGFDFAGAVQWWDGDKFDPGNLSPSLMTLTFGPAEATSPVDDVVAPGFAIPVGPGPFDEHYEFALGDPADDGIYLLALNFWSDQGDIAPAKTTWIVFNWNGEEAEHDEAIDWVRENYVPAPGSGVAALLSIVVLGRRRR
jgi:hypothetical protein